MGRNINNKLLHEAKKGKSDEFYTLMEDVERELQYYKGQFKGKRVYCNCDDPRKSNFFKYFANHFMELGLEQLVGACYTSGGNNLFSAGEECRGYYCILTKEDYSKTSSPEHRFQYFTSNGDFRSDESIAFLKQSDIVVTNPPFSLFREYLAQLMNFDKKFLIISNINAITYKEVFELIKANKIWLGKNLGRGISGFIVPASYELYGTEAKINAEGQRIIATNNCMWLTNLDTPKRTEFLTLNKLYYGNEQSYANYDNCDAINIGKTQDIPMDYAGWMGVPITFLHKYNPEQFEILRFRKGDDDKDLSINGICPYFRILIRNRHPKDKKEIS